MGMIQEMVFSELFSEVDGYDINRKAIERQSNYDNYATQYIGKTLYGETPFTTIKQILLNPLIAQEVKNAKVFYDLGSGMGNVVIGTALLNLFEECNGVELFKSSHETAQVRKQILSKIAPQLARKNQFF